MVPALRIPDSTTLGTREPTYTNDDEGECEAPRSGKENNLEDNGRDRCRPVPRPKRPRPRDGTVDDADYGNDVYSSSLSEVECIGLAKSSSSRIQDHHHEEETRHFLFEGREEEGAREEEEEDEEDGGGMGGNPPPTCALPR